jgi:hypothetical protein
MMSGRYAALDILMRIDTSPVLSNNWVNPIIAKIVTVGADSSRDSRRGRRSYRLNQILTRGEFRNQYEKIISPCKSCNKTSFQDEVYATTGLTL